MFNCINIDALMNTYGHPHEELLERLSRVNSDVYITYKGGAIIIETDGSKMKKRTYLQ